MSVIILGIESSCDETSASVVKDGYVISNYIANQTIHQKYGGVVPELASRAHQQNIIPVVDMALKEAGVWLNQISAIAFTRGPGLLGALLVGTSFAKGLALSLDVPIIDVNHLQAHILVHFIKKDTPDFKMPKFPMLCLLVSGGHTQLVLVEDFLKMEIIGQTIDDAAGEAFDKCAKIMGLGYPGGPVIDKLAQSGDPTAFKFAKPRVDGLDFSFSGLKTSFLYFLRDRLQEDPNFIENNRENLCASLQKSIVDILIDKTKKAIKQTNVKSFGIAGGVSANSELRKAAHSLGKELKLDVYTPELSLTTDNAAMVAIAGYYKFLNNEFADHGLAPLARMPF